VIIWSWDRFITFCKTNAHGVSGTWTPSAVVILNAEAILTILGKLCCTLRDAERSSVEILSKRDEMMYIFQKTSVPNSVLKLCCKTKVNGRTFLFTTAQTADGIPGDPVLPVNHLLQAFITKFMIQTALNDSKKILRGLFA
jgi:hypothetical protein